MRTFDMLAMKNPYIKSAYEQLQVISQDKQKRLEYETREKAIRDHNQLMKEAREQGQVDLIISCLKKGKTCEQITEFLEIPFEDVKQIKENLHLTK